MDRQKKLITSVSRYIRLFNFVFTFFLLTCLDSTCVLVIPPWPIFFYLEFLSYWYSHHFSLQVQPSTFSLVFLNFHSVSHHLSPLTYSKLNWRRVLFRDPYHLLTLFSNSFFVQYIFVRFSKRPNEKKEFRYPLLTCYKS